MLNQTVMKKTRFKYWQEEKHYLGYLVDYPDYMTQGETLDDLKEHLKDIYYDLSEGYIPNARKVDELEVA